MGIQVDTLVKDKKSYEKEFIDFEFDGKHISDFGMVAVFDGDRHTFSSTSEFEDETSEVAGVNGQYFWGTKLKPLQMSFSLATDGMTEKQINAFKQHFQPGRYGEFIECATSNRKRYGRISKPTEFKMIPFKKEMNIGGKSFYVTEYKGEATIDFVFDDPYSYAILKQFDCNIATAQPWQLKVAYEDGIPFLDDTIMEKTNGEKQFKFYNPSNTLALPKIEFKLHDVTPSPQSLSSHEDLSYYHIFQDEFTNPNKPYVSILLKKNINDEESLQICRFTAPDIFYSYNHVINIAAKHTDTNKISLIEKLKEQIVNQTILQYALAKLNDSKVSMDNELVSGWQLQFNNLFKTFFYAISEYKDDANTIPEYDTSGKDIILTLDSQKQKAYISYYHLTPDGKKEIWVKEEDCGEIMLTDYLKLEGGLTLDENFKINEYYILLLENFKNWTWYNSLEFNYTYI